MFVPSKKCDCALTLYERNIQRKTGRLTVVVMMWPRTKIIGQRRIEIVRFLIVKKIVNIWTCENVKIWTVTVKIFII